MNEFGRHSLRELATAHDDLKILACNVLKRKDHRVQEGHRGKYKQDVAYVNGFSTFKYPESMHNTEPSLALDVVPWPFDYSEKDYSDKARFKEIVDLYKEEAKKLGIVIRCGIDWVNFPDYPHIELVSKNGERYQKTFGGGDK